MPYLIDGHNLIPKLGLRLDSVDDEMELVALLQEYSRLSRRPLEVYFDGAPPGHAQTRKLGAITAHFVRLGLSADSAIRNRLRALGNAAKNWTVVSSDREVQDSARAVRAQAISSAEFAALIRKTRAASSKRLDDRPLPQSEVDAWMKLFSDTQRRAKSSEEK